MARPIKKIIALALSSIAELPSTRARDFVRCALLNTGQWALNGRGRQTPLWEFRRRLQQVVREMLIGLDEYTKLVSSHGATTSRPRLINANAAELDKLGPFIAGERADLVVTSPPYPGIHMRYHRWQVDGRRESPAPYWIAACHDGEGEAFYNFAGRRDSATDAYFEESLRTLRAIRQVVREGAVMVQMVAFGNRQRHLPRYLQNMHVAGFEELRADTLSPAAGRRRIWRTVPRRRWHVNHKGDLPSAREVVLIHKAV